MNLHNQKADHINVTQEETNAHIIAVLKKAFHLIAQPTNNDHTYNQLLNSLMIELGKTATTPPNTGFNIQLFLNAKEALKSIEESLKSLLKQKSKNSPPKHKQSKSFVETLTEQRKLQKNSRSL
ncbi:hypothetical protein NOVO_01975 [Rickettsiales bacterium Ac37b]|nr:hypothetical protein NOVO_01975 [Rickettsiales bacterium Ac37b]